MKTNQIVESYIDRTVNGVTVRQRTKDSFFLLRDIEKVITKYRLESGGDFKVPKMERYFELESTKQFLAAIERKKGVNPYIRSRGRGVESWVHPHVFLDIMLWANPEFKVEIYDWLNDYLIQNRIDSADSYIIMNGALYTRFPNKSQYPKFISRVNAEIKQIIGVEDWNKASAAQLKARDDFQKLIADMAGMFRDSSHAYEFAKTAFQNRKELINGSGSEATSQNP